MDGETVSTPVPLDMLLPEGTRLVHIGPHKTGTTTVQFAFHSRRREVARQGVHYAGPNSQPAFAVYAVLGRTPAHAKRSPVRRWQKLVREIDGAGQARVVISSESFCDADDRTIERIVGDLDPSRIHIAVTLRPLPAILPSQWQQSVQGGLTVAYPAWLGMIFDEPGLAEASAFWHRHRHDALVDRWAAAVGPERVTVVVADDRDHGAVLRVFESLVGLAPGTLASQEHRTNRSMTFTEIELVRAMNVAFEADELGPKLRHDLVDRGVAAVAMRRTPRPDEPRIRTPEWALERAAGVARQIVAGIGASKVRVAGDLGRLAEPAALRPAAAAGAAATGAATTGAAATGAASTGAGAWPEVAAAAGLGILVASGVVRDRRPGASGIDSVSTDRLRRIVSQRVLTAAAARLPHLAAVRRRLRARPERD